MCSQRNVRRGPLVNYIVFYIKLIHFGVFYLILQAVRVIE